MMLDATNVIKQNNDRHELRLQEVADAVKSGVKITYGDNLASVVVRKPHKQDVKSKPEPDLGGMTNLQKVETMIFHHGSLSSIELATKTGIEKSCLFRLVKRLENKGLVTRKTGASKKPTIFTAVKA